MVSKALKALRRRFGDGFPDITDESLTPEERGKQWRKWLDNRRNDQKSAHRDAAFHYSRHRRFRDGDQWIASRDGRTWRTPEADENDIRIVNNQIGPALDFRLGILTEQRPGFRKEPLGSGTLARETAEAQQQVAEYYYYILRAWLAGADAARFGQTDGVGFIHVYVDDDAGPRIDDVELVPPSDPRYQGLVAQGYKVDKDQNVELPFEDEGVEAPPGAPARKMSQGDLAHRVIEADDVWVDPEARSINGPLDPARWVFIRRFRDIKSARLETGVDDLEPENLTSDEEDVMDFATSNPKLWQQGLPPFPSDRQRMKDTVPEFLVFIMPEPEYLPDGKWLHLIGDRIVKELDELPGKIIPLARFGDGSTDVSLFPRPVMADWIPDQIAINLLDSLIQQHIRLYSGGRTVVHKNSLIEETYGAVVGAKIEYQGPKPDFVEPPSAGGDVWQQRARKIEELHQKTGWTDFARGKVTGEGGFQDVSGRAVLGAREMFERTFGPMIRAHAEGMSEWANIIVKYAQWLFTTPRLIPAVGGRGDLAQLVDSEKLGDHVMTYCDPETLMPLPRALRNQQIFDLLDKGLITPDEAQRRAPYADIRNIHMGDTDQWQRAQWVNMELEERFEELSAMDPIQLYGPEGLPILYQDKPEVHMRALNEIIMEERKPWPLRKLAMDRHGIYDQFGRFQQSQGQAAPLPPEIIGAPPDLAPQPPAPPPVVAPTGLPPGSPGTEGLAAPAMAPVAPPPAANEIAQPLGSIGEVEQAAQLAQEREQR